MSIDPDKIVNFLVNISAVSTKNVCSFAVTINTREVKINKK